MNLRQLNGRHARLRHELSSESGPEEWPQGRIDRFARDIAAVEQAIARLEPGAQQSGENALANEVAGDDAAAGRAPERAPSVIVPMQRLTPFGRRPGTPAGDRGDV